MQAPLYHKLQNKKASTKITTIQRINYVELKENKKEIFNIINSYLFRKVAKQNQNLKLN